MSKLELFSWDSFLLFKEKYNGAQSEYNFGVLEPQEIHEAVLRYFLYYLDFCDFYEDYAHKELHVVMDPGNREKPIFDAPCLRILTGSKLDPLQPDMQRSARLNEMMQGIEDINKNTKDLLSYILNARTFAPQVEMEITYLFHCAYNYFSALEEYTRSGAKLYFLTQENLEGKYNFDRCDHDRQLEEIIGCVKNTRPYMFIPPGGRMLGPS